MILNSYISSRRKRHFLTDFLKFHPVSNFFFNQTRFEESYYRISQSDENFISFIRTITGLNSISVEKYFWLHPTENFYMVLRLFIYHTEFRLRKKNERKNLNSQWFVCFLSKLFLVKYDCLPNSLFKTRRKSILSQTRHTCTNNAI